jgi:hypothetical protein
MSTKFLGADEVLMVPVKKRVVTIDCHAYATISVMTVGLTRH